MFRTNQTPATTVFKPLSEVELANERTSFSPDDYAFSDDQFEIAGVEHQGLRETQEDRMDIAELPGFQYLSAEQQQAVLTETLKEIQDRLLNASSSRSYTGSCLLVNILIPDLHSPIHELVTVSLGDSLSYLASVKKTEAEQTTIEAKLLNKFHKFSNPDEVARVQALTGQPVTGKRLGGILMVTGAMGDMELMPSLTQVPKIYRQRFNAVDAEKDLYAITACDGMVESDFFIAEQLNEQKLHKNGTLQDVAKQLVVKSLFVTNDNVSVILARANNRKAPLTRPLAMAVYDGHGGDYIADMLQKLFLPLLTANVRIKLNQSKRAENTIHDYLTEMEMAFSLSDRPAEFYYHLKRADAIHLRLYGDPAIKTVLSTARTLFLPAPAKEKLTKKMTQCLDSIMSIRNTIDDYYPHGYRAQFDRLQGIILEHCKQYRESLREPAPTLQLEARPCP